jgi:hypothetical protein
MAESGSAPGKRVMDEICSKFWANPLPEMLNKVRVPVRLVNVTSPSMSGFGVKVSPRFSKSIIVGFGLSWLGSVIVIP